MIAAACLLFWLLVWHSLADYPLQGDFMAKAKNFAAPMLGVPWLPVMLSHAVIHAGGVAVVTGSYTLAVFEAVAHFSIDSLKCDNRISYNTDQALHVACKIAYLPLIGILP